MSDTQPQSSAPQTLGFFARLWLCASLELRLLFDGALAWRVKRAVENDGPALPPHDDNAPSLPEPTEETEEKGASQNEALEEKLIAAKAEVAEAKAAQEALQKQLSQAQAAPDAALHLLAIFQRDGRFVDFLQEDVAGFSDADIGGAARLVHQGCQKALQQYFVLKPIRDEEEESAVVIEEGFDPAAIRLTGNVTGTPPYKGTLAHAGWRAVEVNLPSLPGDADVRIIAPAEVEL